MNSRALRALRLLGPFIIACVLTWLVSWFVQFLCYITVDGQKFSVTDRDVNRLAFATVAAVIIVALLVMLILTLNGCWLFFVWVTCWPSLIAAIGWAATVIFPGTPVATVLAQLIYGFAVLIWGILMWYVFLEEVTYELSKA